MAIEWTFRPIVYSGALPTGVAWDVPPALVETRKLWSIYERNDLLSSASLIIFAASLSRLRQEASDNFTYYESVESFAEHYSGDASVRGALDALSGKTFGELVGYVRSAGPSLANWGDPMHEFSLEGQLVADWYARSETAASFHRQCDSTARIACSATSRLPICLRELANPSSGSGNIPN